MEVLLKSKLLSDGLGQVEQQIEVGFAYRAVPELLEEERGFGNSPDYFCIFVVKRFELLVEGDHLDLRRLYLLVVDDELLVRGTHLKKVVSDGLVFGSLFLILRFRVSVGLLFNFVLGDVFESVGNSLRVARIGRQDAWILIGAEGAHELRVSILTHHLPAEALAVQVSVGVAVGFVRVLLSFDDGGKSLES